jgi:integrase
MRIGEVCALRWSDIDVDEGVFRVGRTIQRIYIVDGDKRYTKLNIDTAKTKNSEREIPISKKLLKQFKAIKKVVNDDFYVLTNDKKPTEPRTYRNYYKDLLGQLKIPPIKFHGLRHTFATYCIEGGADVKTTSVLLGHSNVSITLNIYVHPDFK